MFLGKRWATLVSGLISSTRITATNTTVSINYVLPWRGIIRISTAYLVTSVSFPSGSWHLPSGYRPRADINFPRGITLISLGSRWISFNYTMNMTEMLDSGPWYITFNPVYIEIDIPWPTHYARNCECWLVGVTLPAHCSRMLHTTARCSRRPLHWS